MGSKMKFSASQVNKHNQAMALVNSDKVLTHEECEFIMQNFLEGADSINSAVGAFFTPIGLSQSFACDLPIANTAIDLCAGIGVLAYYAYHYGKVKNITCVELNPDYIKIGKRILPEANWIQADVLSLNSDQKFDIAISNPPFGNIKTSKVDSLAYTGSRFEYKVTELASKISKIGFFILPQNSTGHLYSGHKSYSTTLNTALNGFKRDTGLDYELMGCTDTAAYLNDWRGVKPLCELVMVDFRELSKKVA